MPHVGEDPVQVDFQTACEARLGLRLLGASAGTSRRASECAPQKEAAPLRRFELCIRLFEGCDVDVASAVGASVAEAETAARGGAREALLHEALALMRLAVDHRAVRASDLALPPHLRQVRPHALACARVCV
jgi:hypothetical protein